MIQVTRSVHINDLSAYNLVYLERQMYNQLISKCENKEIMFNPSNLVFRRTSDGDQMITLTLTMD